MTDVCDRHERPADRLLLPLSHHTSQMFCETRAVQPSSGFTKCTRTQKPSISTRPKHITKAGLTSRPVGELSAASATKPTENSLEGKLKSFSACSSKKIETITKSQRRIFFVHALVAVNSNAYYFTKLDIYLRYDVLALD